MSKPTQCEFEFAPGVRCQMVAGHDEPYYPYHDYGQWGEYGTILSEGSRHEVHSARPGRPPQEVKRIVKCRAYAGSLSTGLECNREEGHPGMHRDNYVNAYWKHGAPHLDVIELPAQPSEPGGVA